MGLLDGIKKAAGVVISFKADTKDLNKGVTASKQALTKLQNALRQTQSNMRHLRDDFKTGKISAQEFNTRMQGLTMTSNGLKDKVWRAREEVRRMGDDMRESSLKAQKFQQSLEKVKAVGQGIKSVGRTMTTFLTAPILGAGVAAVKASGDLDELDNKIEVVFGKNNVNKIEEWSKAQEKALNRGQTNIKEYASEYQVMLTAMGLDKNLATEITKNLTTRQIDIGSLYNMDDKDVAVRILSGLTGETEAIKRLGVDLFQPNMERIMKNMGLKGNFTDLNQATKVLIRYKAIMEGTAFSEGDAAKTKHTLMNETKGLKDQTKELAVNWGEELKPLALDIVQGLRKMVDWLKNLSPQTKENIVKFAGLVAALGPFLLIVGQTIIVLSNLVQLINFLKGAMTALKVAETGAAIGGLATPIGWVVLAIGAVIGAIYLLYKNWDSIVKFFGDGAVNIANTFKELGAIIYDDFKTIGLGIKTFWSNVFASIGNFLKGGLQKFIEFGRNIPKAVLKGFLSVPKAIINGAKNVITGAVEVGKDLINYAKSEFNFSSGVTSIPSSTTTNNTKSSTINVNVEGGVGSSAWEREQQARDLAKRINNNVYNESQVIPTTV